MANRLSQGPLQLTTLDLPSINYMLQIIRKELDELRGLRGEHTVHDTFTVDGNVNADNLAAATTAEIAAVGGTAVGGVLESKTRGDHVHVGVRRLTSDATAVDPDATTGEVALTGEANTITLTPSGSSIDIKVKDSPTFVGTVSLSAGGLLDLSAIAAGSPNVKITATSDVPTVVWTGGGSAPTTAPAGYLEILVGASARYIPFWI